MGEEEDPLLTLRSVLRISKRERGEKSRGESQRGEERRGGREGRKEGERASVR